MSWTKRITITKGTQEWKKVYQTALKGLVSLVRFHQPALGTPAPGADWCLAFPKLPARPVPLPFFHLSPSVPSSGIAGPSANKIWLVIFIVRIERWDNSFSRYRGDFWSFFEISSLFLMSLGEPDLIGFFTSSSLFTYERLQEKGMTEKTKLNKVAWLDFLGGIPSKF